MKIGDKVLADGCIGVIVQKYQGGSAFDWEIAFINKAPKNCWLDCYKECRLKKYNWKPYPKTWRQIIRVILQLSKKQ